MLGMLGMLRRGAEKTLSSSCGAPELLGLGGARCKSAEVPVERVLHPPTPHAWIPQDQGKQQDRVLSVTRLLGHSEQREQPLAGAVWDVPLRVDIAHRVVEWQRAKQRAGTAFTKSRAEVAGTTGKPFRQKGTGNARAGDRKAPHHNRGGKAHGAVPRSFSYTLPKQIKRFGLKVALSARLAESRLNVVDSLSHIGPKTKAFKRAQPRLASSAAGKNTMLLVLGNDEDMQSITKATSNVQGIEVLPARGTNVLSILRRQSLVATPAAIGDLEKRLTTPINR